MKTGFYSNTIGKLVEKSRPEFIENIPLAPQINEFLKEYSFASYNKHDNSIYIKQGKWNIVSDMIIPEGCSLIIPPGTKLLFKPKRFLLLRGALRAVGTKDEKIILGPQEGNWSGLVVLGKNEISKLENVIIKDCTGVKRGGWVLTAAVTFYKSRVNVNHVLVQGTECEDAVN